MGTFKQERFDLQVSQAITNATSGDRRITQPEEAVRNSVRMQIQWVWPRRAEELSGSFDSLNPIGLRYTRTRDETY